MSANSPLKVLFISRAYPPVVGGIEKHNYEIAKALSLRANVTVVANQRGKRFLPIFLCQALWHVLWNIKHYDVVLLGDGVLAVIGFVIKKISNKPVVCVLHGLDITFSQWVYQKLWVGCFLAALDQYIAVGNETIHQGVLRGLDKHKFQFIGNGVDESYQTVNYQRADVESLLGYELTKPVLLTLGRLVKRKGVEWFVREVMPKLSNDVTYIIAGSGKESSAIQQAITDTGLSESIVFLGAVNEQQKQILLQAADLFIQPNIVVAGDMEGFGLVVLEAAAAGTMVLASDLEGLKDAIHHNKNGLLVAPENPSAYIAVIQQLLQDTELLQQKGQEAAIYVATHFSWHVVAARYLQLLEHCVKTCK